MCVAFIIKLVSFEVTQERNKRKSRGREKQTVKSESELVFPRMTHENQSHNNYLGKKLSLAANI